jgi:hypothetical protein
MTDSQWHVGQRVGRLRNDELGSVVEIERGTVKVKWDDGKTSYYQRRVERHIRLARERRQNRLDCRR